MRRLLLFLAAAVGVLCQGVDHHAQVLNRPEISDDQRSRFSTIYAACSAAVSAGTTLAVTTTWPVSATSECGVPLVFNGGEVRPESGRTITFTVQSAPLSQVCDLSLGGHCIIASATGNILPQWWGAKGDGRNNDTAAIQACFNNALHSCYLPNGIYSVDPDVVTIRGTGWQAIRGEAAGLFNTTTGVEIRARSAGQNLILIRNKIGIELDNIYLNGNRLALYPVRIADQSSDIVTHNLVVSSPADNGCNVFVKPASGINTQIDYLEFYHTNFAGDLNGTSGSNVCNLKLQNNQTVRFTLYNPSFQATSAISESIHLENGAITMYSPTFTGAVTPNMDINQISGNLTIYEGRSESQTMNSIVIGQAAGAFDLENFVHGAPSGYVTLTVNAAFAGIAIVRGGQFSSIVNNSTATIFLDQVKQYPGATIGGTHPETVHSAPK